MDDPLSERLKGTALKEAVLGAVAADGLDRIPPDFDDTARFVICAVRAVATRPDARDLSLFVYSAAPLSDGKLHRFTRVMHMQDGLGEVAGMVILTGRDANNGAARAFEGRPLESLIDDLEEIGLDRRATVIWDPAARTATVYPDGTREDQVHVRFAVPAVAEDLTQDEVCVALDAAYNENLKNPSARTVRLWIKGKLVDTAEDEIERHIKGQMTVFFLGRRRPIRVLSQTNTAAGRTDLMFFQQEPPGGPRLCGVLELKVLRGPPAVDLEVTAEGLSQGYHYRAELELPFSTLALYDVTTAPSAETAPLLAAQNPDHLNMVRVRRFPLFSAPKAWRDAGGPRAP